MSEKTPEIVEATELHEPVIVLADGAEWYPDPNRYIRIQLPIISE